jgi:phage terminase large subunit
MSFAKMAAIWGVVEPLRILCVREFQASIKDSFHAELKAAIASEPWLVAAYDVGVDYLRSKINGTEFLFKGLYNNLTSVKGTANIDLTIAEEAEDISEDAWVALEATILRKLRSECWIIWNPKDEGSPTDTRFRTGVSANDPDYAIVELNADDNPWFPIGLKKLRDKQRESFDQAKFDWIWKGAYLTNDESKIFAGCWKEGIRFPDSTWHGPYHGLDFGFSMDPTAAVRCWISPDESELYIDKEAGKVGLELDDTAEFLIERIPGIEKEPVIADSARPESISHLSKAKTPNGLPKKHYLQRIEGAVKGPGSVEDGIDHLKTYSIIVHPGCAEVQKEFKKYSFKVDRLTGEVTRTIVDKYNHYIDALRYAVEKVMKAKGNQVGMLFRRDN